jgi:hypothetical protein
LTAVKDARILATGTDTRGRQTVSLTDVRGTVHEVTVSEESRDYWTAGGVMLAACACGWADRVAYAPGSPFAEAMTKDFADLKLRERASAHVPAIPLA